jgi:hypothetical protein
LAGSGVGEEDGAEADSQPMAMTAANDNTRKRADILIMSLSVFRNRNQLRPMTKLAPRVMASIRP